MKKSTIIDILRSDKTVFSFKEILLTSGEHNPALLRGRLYYYVKKGQLHPIRRGLYAKDKNYDKFELATKVFTPSYVSFETVLADAGIIFQKYRQIFMATYLTREITCDNRLYTYKKIRNELLTNPAGIEQKDNYAIASPERAFLDVLYLNKEYHFDNLRPLNWEKAFALLPMYGNQRMEKKMSIYYEDFKANQ